MNGPPPGETASPSDRLYEVQEVARLTGVGQAQLRRWDRNGMIPASARRDGRRFYAFRDVIAVRTAAGLLASGVRSAQVRQAIEALRVWRPDVEAPLASLRVFADGSRLIVRVDGTLMEPVTGQTLLALPVGEIAQAAAALDGEMASVAPLRPRRPEPADAQAWFELALEAESTGDDDATAETRYRRALEFDDEHPGALLNLGNLMYARAELDEACELYRSAVQISPDYPEGHYNLANVLDDLGQSDAAVAAYEEALRLAPEFKAAHFNLALVWEKAGQRDRAREHWRRYLLLDDESPSAQVARDFLHADDID